MTTLIAATPVLADWDWNGHMSNGWWIVMIIGMVLFWALVIVGIVWLVRTVAGGQHAAHAGHHVQATTPLELLDRRLADGSISVEEYEERRRILTGSEPSDSP